MAVNDSILLQVLGVVSGQQHIHTLHFRALGVSTFEQNIIDLWQANARTAYRGLFAAQNSPCQLYRASHVCGSLPLRATVEETEVAPNIVGSRTNADDMPPFVASVFSERTVLAGKSRRGRFYISGVLETDQNAGTLNAAYVTLMNAYITALMGAFTGSGATSNGAHLVVHSPTLAAVPGTQCEDSSTLVSGIIPRSALGTMRSRKAGSGI